MKEERRRESWSPSTEARLQFHPALVYKEEHTTPRPRSVSQSSAPPPLPHPHTPPSPALPPAVRATPESGSGIWEAVIEKCK